MIANLRSYLSGNSLGSVLVTAITGSAGLRFAGMGFGFLVGIQLARELGAEGYGIYGVAISIIALLTVPTEFGYPQLLTFEVASAKVNQNWGRMKGIIRWSSQGSLQISITIGIGLVAWLLLTGKGPGSPLGITLLAGMLMIPVVAQLSISSAALRGLQQIVRGQLPEVLLRPMLYSLLLFLFSLWGLPLTPAVAITLSVISAAAALLLAMYMLRKAMPDEVNVAVAIEEPRTWLLSAFPMAAIEGMRLLQAHLLLLLIGAMMSMSDVGVFRVASSIVLLIATPISLLNIVSMPVIAKFHASGDTVRIQRLLSLVALGMTVGVIILFLPFIFFGDSLLDLLFGPEFSGSHEVLIVLGTGVVINAAFGANAAVLNMTGHQSLVMRASFLALLLLAIAAPPMILCFGILGAAASSVISIIVWNFLMWRDGAKHLSCDASIYSFIAPGGFKK